MTCPSDTTPLIELSIPPKAVAILKTEGIHTRGDLHRCGPVYAFLLLKAAALGVTESLLWRLVQAADTQTHWPPTLAEKQSWHDAIRQHPPVAIFPPTNIMQSWMAKALDQARLALQYQEVPVGAVIVRENTLIAAAHNQCVTHHNVSHHAEIQALNLAGMVTNNYRLDGCDVYVTLEPCAMCASALIQARVRRVIFGATEPKTGAAGSVLNLFNEPKLNAHTACRGGVLASESQALLQTFFQHRR
ncbi:tRNA adenosine(34) deaminase TadA [Snodgrassella sp. CFCC 13594]|uniref:tRNA adenosine(34) deaminase TadA n=1 Tax=Snodgrassella sp. CFCC 13594 TaxID=1775559 RepID=UPI0008362BFC|nr:tRNA adenosine(34) deaminase TadA [Snodgrassella sp. CFCC 13594]